LSAITDFQTEHGEAWLKIVKSPAFMAAMQHLNQVKINEIIGLEPEAITNHSREILSELQGHLRHENDLISLATAKELDFESLPDETYPDPNEELAPPPKKRSTTKRKK
jgi:hypothetical protein